MDSVIGRILDALEREKMAQNTLVLFCSDNGGAGQKDNLPLRDGKLSVYEGGIRVPGASIANSQRLPEYGGLDGFVNTF